MELLSKQQLRTRETQARLLAAAEEVFVRDGYENAQLDTIAAAAGRSKGAVYTHFKNKEDLFLALFEQKTRLFIDRLISSLRKRTSRKQSLDAFREFYVGLVHDNIWPILTLEFKLYALRHPESKERFRKAFEMTKPSNQGNEGDFHKQIFGTVTKKQRKANDLALVSLGPVLSGLILDSHFEPEILSGEGLQDILGRIFDALFPATE
jgi:AcrR family transcriptional regulator